MQSYEVLHEAAERVGVKVLAGELRLSPALVYKWCQQPESGDHDASGTRNPLDRISEIVKVTGHVPVVGWLCHEAGGFFVQNPRVRGDRDPDLLQSTQQMVLGFSKLLADVSGSVADDNEINAKEADRIRASWERLKSRAEEFVIACERGLYQRPAAERE